MKKFTAILLLPCLVACQNVQKEKETAGDVATDGQEIAITADTLTFTYDSVKVYSKNAISPNKEITDTAKASFRFPVFKDSVLNAMVQERALVSNNPDAPKYNTYLEQATAFIKNFDQFKAENKDSYQTWFKDVRIQVLPQWKNYLGLQYTFFDYEGGAHTNTVVIYKNYDLNNNRLITLDDIIQPDKKTELTAIAEKIFRQNEGLTPDQKLSEGYFFDQGVFSLNDNFALTHEGLKFLYNSYEIKAYAFGRTTLLIPYESIKHILKSNPILPLQN